MKDKDWVAILTFFLFLVVFVSVVLSCALRMDAQEELPVKETKGETSEEKKETPAPRALEESKEEAQAENSETEVSKEPSVAEAQEGSRAGEIPAETTVMQGETSATEALEEHKEEPSKVEPEGAVKSQEVELATDSRAVTGEGRSNPALSESLVAGGDSQTAITKEVQAIADSVQDLSENLEETPAPKALEGAKEENSETEFSKEPSVAESEVLAPKQKEAISLIRTGDTVFITAVMDAVLSSEVVVVENMDSAGLYKGVLVNQRNENVKIVIDSSIYYLKPHQIIEAYLPKGVYYFRVINSRGEEFARGTTVASEVEKQKNKHRNFFGKEFFYVWGVRVY